VQVWPLEIPFGSSHEPIWPACLVKLVLLAKFSDIRGTGHLSHMSHITGHDARTRSPILSHSQRGIPSSSTSAGHEKSSTQLNSGALVVVVVVVVVVHLPHINGQICVRWAPTMGCLHFSSQSHAFSDLEGHDSSSTQVSGTYTTVIVVVVVVVVGGGGAGPFTTHIPHILGQSLFNLGPTMGFSHL